MVLMHQALKNLALWAKSVEMHAGDQFLHDERDELVEEAKAVLKKHHVSIEEFDDGD